MITNPDPDLQRNSLLTATRQIQFNKGEFYKTGLSTPKPGRIIGDAFGVPIDLQNRRIYCYACAQIYDPAEDFFASFQLVGVLRGQEVFALPLQIHNGFGLFNGLHSVFQTGGEAEDSMVLAVPISFTQVTDHTVRLNPLHLTAAIDSLRLDLLDSSDNSNGNNWPTSLYGFIGCLSSIV